MQFCDLLCVFYLSGCFVLFCLLFAYTFNEEIEFSAVKGLSKNEFLYVILFNIAFKIRQVN